MTVLSPTIEPEAMVATRSRVDRLNAELRGASAETIMRVAIEEEFPGRIAVISAFAVESAVLVNLTAEIDPATPLLFLDTGKHFPETLTHRAYLIERLGLTDARLITPFEDQMAAEDPDGDLWSRDPDACCALRKTRPLASVLEGFDAWVTGRKRFQSETRMALKTVDMDDEGRVKFNPLANWSRDDVDTYLKERDLPYHPLFERGYPSIGCAPCTSPVAPGEDPRAGRWRGQEKTECGIHFTVDGRIVRTGEQ